MRITLQIDELAALLSEAGKTVRTPSLDRLLTLAKVKKKLTGNAEQSLLHHFEATAPVGGSDRNPPIAAFCALANELPISPGSHDYWLRADPVSLQAGMSRVFLQAIGATGLPEIQRKQLEQSLNQHFNQEGLVFYLPDNQHWYIHLRDRKKAGQLLPPPRQSLGLDISAEVAAMRPFWQRVFTEIQMLLFNLDFIQGRLVQGLAPISGLWLWGGGALGSVRLRGVQYECFGQSRYLQGLAVASNSVWSAHYVPAEQGRGEKAAARTTISGANNQLIHWSGNQAGSAIEQIERLEAELFRPLLKTVERGVELDLLASDASIVWKITKHWQWPWRKKITASAYIASLAGPTND